jgi:hypothetical protein
MFIEILVYSFDGTGRVLRNPVGYGQAVWLCWQVTFVDVPSYNFVYFKLNRLTGNDCKGFSLTTVAGFWGVIVLLEDMEVKWRVV